LSQDTIKNLKEAVVKDNDRFPDGWEGYIEKAKESTFFRRVMKEALYKDVAGALGAIHDRVIEAAKPDLIGREMIWVVPTNEALVRFYKAKLAKAYEVSETAPPEKPEKMETQDIQATIELACKMTFSRSYIEDAPWAVLQRAGEEAGRAIAQLETEKIFNLYNSIADGDLAGGAVQATGDGSSFAWADVVKLWATVKKENFSPTVLCVNPAEAEGLLAQNQFIQSLYYAPEQVIRRGVFADIRWLDLRILVSTLVTAATKLAIDTNYAAVMLVRRDLTTEAYEDPGNMRTGMIVTERIGLGVLRNKAVAKGT